MDPGSAKLRRSSFLASPLTGVHVPPLDPLAPEWRRNPLNGATGRSRSTVLSSRNDLSSSIGLGTDAGRSHDPLARPVSTRSNPPGLGIPNRALGLSRGSTSPSSTVIAIHHREHRLVPRFSSVWSTLSHLSSVSPVGPRRVADFPDFQARPRGPREMR